jgi:hypothetical protein
MRCISYCGHFWVIMDGKCLWAWQHYLSLHVLLFAYVLVLSNQNSMRCIACLNCWLFPFQVHECFPFSIAVSWKGGALDSQNGAADHQQGTIVFPKGNPIPSIKALTFYRSGTFSIDVQYSDVSELQAPAKISTYTVRSQHAVFKSQFFNLCDLKGIKFSVTLCHMNLTCRSVLSNVQKVNVQKWRWKSVWVYMGSCLLNQQQ